MYTYVGLSLASGQPWQMFQRNDELDLRINVTYAAILKAQSKRSSAKGRPGGPQMSG